MRVAFQIDELQKLNFYSDTSIILLEEAIRRNLQVYFYYPKTLSLKDNKVISNAYKVKSIRQYNGKDIPIEYEEVGYLDLSNLDFIFLRQDPPFDLAYITSTFLLEKIADKVKVINDPKSVRNSPEKLLVTEFSHLMPKTLISCDFKMIWQFLEEHKKCVIKPLYGNAGSDVFFLQEGDFNAKSIIEYFLHTFKEQVMVQEFLPNVKKGDKRIILIDGEARGVVNRIPAQNEIKSNLAAGGKAAITSLSDKDIYICNEISPKLKELGLFFVGIDVIDGFLTEINVTSPTGLRGIIDLYGQNLAQDVWDILLRKAK